MAKGLIGVVRQAVDNDMLRSVEVGTKKVKVSMLHFADDTIFFCKDNTHNVMVIKSMLCCFELVSGLKVNFSKSRLGGVSVRQPQLWMYASILNCEVMKVPFTYLDMEVGGNHRRTNFWGKVIEKIRKRLDRWKGKFLSMAGRICMLKSVLSSISLFYMSFYKTKVSGRYN